MKREQVCRMSIWPEEETGAISRGRLGPGPGRSGENNGLDEGGSEMHPFFSPIRADLRTMGPGGRKERLPARNKRGRFVAY